MHPFVPGPKLSQKSEPFLDIFAYFGCAELKVQVHRLPAKTSTLNRKAVKRSERTTQQSPKQAGHSFEIPLGIRHCFWQLGIHIGSNAEIKIRHTYVRVDTIRARLNLEPTCSFASMSTSIALTVFRGPGSEDAQKR